MLSVSDHQLADRLAFHRRVELTDQATAIDPPDAIGDSQYFIKVFANQQDGNVALAGFTQIFMHCGTGPYVKTAGW